MEKSNDKMLTLVQVYQKLKERGITAEFKMNEEGIMSLSTGKSNYKPEELCVRRSYRFEGDSNPEDNAVLYVLEDNDGNKGTLLDSYGAESNYSGEFFDNFLRQIPVDEDEILNFHVDRED